jgi:ribosomal protein S18 acetylase RimI-like enzyme
MSEEAAEHVSIRRASIDDRDRLYAVHRAALGPYVAELWGWDEDWQAEHFAKRFDPHRVQVIECDGYLAGFFITIEDGGGTMLSTIEIEPQWQGRGLGTAIINGLVANAQAGGKSVRLQVFKVNHRAHDLYRRLGFVKTGETATYVLLAMGAGASPIP